MMVHVSPIGVHSSSASCYTCFKSARLLLLCQRMFVHSWRAEGRPAIRRAPEVRRRVDIVRGARPAFPCVLAVPHTLFALRNETLVCLLSFDRCPPDEIRPCRCFFLWFPRTKDGTVDKVSDLCQLTVYVVWTGTDSKGNYFTSFSKRLSMYAGEVSYSSTCFLSVSLSPVFSC